MNKRRHINPFLLGGAILVLVLTVAALIFYSSIPDANHLIPPGSTGMVVDLSSPNNGTVLSLNHVVTVLGSALGTQSIRTMTLWVDGAKQDTIKAVQGGGFWTWMPGTAGRHILIAEATDVQGRSAYSNPVEVTFFQSSASDKTSYIPQPSDTLGTISSKFDIPLADLSGVNPGIGAGTALSSNTPVNIPQSAAESPLSLPNPIPVTNIPDNTSGTPDKLGLWLDVRKGITTPAAPVALSAGLASCDVVLNLAANSSDASGYFIYRLDGSSTGFARIATLGKVVPGNTATYVDKSVYGPVMYYAASFNAAGETDSNLVSLNVNSSACAPQSPSSYMFKKITITPSQPVDKLYCYFSYGNNQWSRVPSGADTFVYPIGGVFDFTPYVNGVGTLDVSPDAQCWGWTGATLLPLGNAQGVHNGMDESFQLKGNLFVVDAQLVGFDPTAHGPMVVEGGPTIAPPVLVRTTDLTTCMNHFPNDVGTSFISSLLCSSGISNSSVILAWIHGTSTSPSMTTDVDGYRIYINPPGKPHILVATINSPDTSSVKGQTVYFFDADRFPVGTIFTVRGFTGKFESPDSNQYVLARTYTGLTTILLNPEPQSMNPASLHTTDTQTYKTPGFDLGKIFSICTAGTGSEILFDNALEGTNVLVGQDYSYKPNCALDWSNDIFKGSIVFDTTQIKGPVLSAVLTFNQDKSQISGYTTGGDCPVGTLDQLDSVDASGNVTGSTPYVDMYYIRQGENTYETDVTDVIRQWLDPGSSDLPGFALVANPATLSHDSDTRTSYCWATYSDFQLVVTYFTK